MTATVILDIRKPIGSPNFIVEAKNKKSFTSVLDSTFSH